MECPAYKDIHSHFESTLKADSLCELFVEGNLHKMENILIMIHTKRVVMERNLIVSCFVDWISQSLRLFWSSGRHYKSFIHSFIHISTTTLLPTSPILWILSFTTFEVGWDPFLLYFMNSTSEFRFPTK